LAIKRPGGAIAQTFDTFSTEPFDPFGDRLRRGIELARGGGLLSPASTHRAFENERYGILLSCTAA
jgi:hypothetical protein